MSGRAAAVVVASLAAALSCDVDPCGASPAAFTSRAEAFFAEAAAAEHDASSAAWDLYDERLRELVTECYPRHEGGLTREQERAFRRGVRTYYVQRFGRAGAREALRELSGGLREGLGALDRWLDDNL